MVKKVQLILKCKIFYYHQVSRIKYDQTYKCSNLYLLRSIYHYDIIGHIPMYVLCTTSYDHAETQPEYVGRYMKTYKVGYSISCSTAYLRRIFTFTTCVIGVRRCARSLYLIINTQNIQVQNLCHLPTQNCTSFVS